MESLVIDPSTYKFSPKEFSYNYHPDGGTYIHRFPVWKYKRTTILECVIAIDELTGEIRLNVYDINKSPYAPFYAVYFGNYDPMLDQIYNTINAELKRLGLIQND